MIEVCFAPMPPPITSWSIKPTKAATAKVALTVPAQNTFNIPKCNNQNWFVLCFLCRGQEIIFGLTLFLADYASTILDFFPPGVAVMDHKETFAEMGNLGWTLIYSCHQLLQTFTNFSIKKTLKHIAVKMTRMPFERVLKILTRLKLRGELKYIVNWRSKIWFWDFERHFGHSWTP